MIKVVPFHIEHISIMEIRHLERDTVFKEESFITRLEQVASLGMAANTVILDGRILFCGGFYLLWEGVAECWIVPSCFVSGAAMQYAKMVRRFGDQIIRDFKLHRIQTSIPVGSIQEGWMRFLGFEKEGLAKQLLYDKRDCLRYARIT